MEFVIATFYHLQHLSNYYDMQSELKRFCINSGIKGTIILAEEGINATISGDAASINLFFEFLCSDKRLKNISYHESFSNVQPFQKMKVKLRPEVVRLSDHDSSLEDFNKSYYVSPEEWDNLILDDNVYVIDTRNGYEINFGKFKNSINPNTKTFREFPEWAENWVVDKAPDKCKVAMYCTGGIRCEKSAKVMNGLGFKHIYQLKGGILNYLEKTKNKSNLWQGECFVFDDRIVIDSNLKPSKEIKCISCFSYVTHQELISISKGQVLCFSCRAYINQY